MRVGATQLTGLGARWFAGAVTSIDRFVVAKPSRDHSVLTSAPQLGQRYGRRLAKLRWIAVMMSGKATLGISRVPSTSPCEGQSPIAVWVSAYYQTNFPDLIGG